MAGSILIWIMTFIRQYTTQLLWLSLMFAFHMKRREHFLPKFIISAGLFLALPYIMGYGGVWLVIDGWFMLAFFIDFVLCGLILFLCFDITWRHVLFFISAAYTMQHCIDMSVWLFVGCMNLPFDGMFTMCITTIIRLTMDCVFYFAFAHRLKNADLDDDNCFAINNFYVLAVTIIAVIMVYVTSMFVSYKGWSNEGYYIYSIISCLLLLLFQFGLLEQGKKKQEQENLQRMLAMEHEQHKMSQENILMINMKCHNLKHQIAALRKTMDSEQMKSRLSDLERAVMIYDSEIKTGNAALDVVLTEKSLACESYGIKFSCVADGKALSFFEDEDIYTFFGNAMDNAIESVKLIDDVECRIISLSIFVKDKLLVIHIDNFCGNTPVFKNGLPITTKSDKNYHGFGVLSIKYIAEKYGGTFSAFVKDNQFKLNILIPLL